MKRSAFLFSGLFLAFCGCSGVARTDEVDARTVYVGSAPPLNEGTGSQLSPEKAENGRKPNPWDRHPQSEVAGTFDPDGGTLEQDAGVASIVDAGIPCTVASGICAGAGVVTDGICHTTGQALHGGLWLSSLTRSLTPASVFAASDGGSLHWYTLTDSWGGGASHFSVAANGTVTTVARFNWPDDTVSTAASVDGCLLEVHKNDVVCADPQTSAVKWTLADAGVDPYWTSPGEARISAIHAQRAAIAFPRVAPGDGGLYPAGADLYVVDTNAGSVLTSRHVPDYVTEMISDGLGREFLSDGALHALDANLAEIWTANVDAGTKPLATFDGKLYLSDGSVVSTSDGSNVGQLYAGVVTQVRVTPTAGWAVGVCAPNSVFCFDVVTFDPNSLSIIHTTRITEHEYAGSPTVSPANTLVLPMGGFNSRPYPLMTGGLFEVTSDGTIAACDGITSNARFRTTFAGGNLFEFYDDYYLSVSRSFGVRPNAVPGGGAVTGWIDERGSRRGTGSPE